MRKVSAVRTASITCADEASSPLAQQARSLNQPSRDGLVFCSPKMMIHRVIQHRHDNRSERQAGRASMNTGRMTFNLLRPLSSALSSFAVGIVCQRRHMPRATTPLRFLEFLLRGANRLPHRGRVLFPQQSLPRSSRWPIRFANAVIASEMAAKTSPGVLRNSTMCSTSFRRRPSRRLCQPDQGILMELCIGLLFVFRRNGIGCSSDVIQTLRPLLIFSRATLWSRQNE